MLTLLLFLPPQTMLSVNGVVLGGDRWQICEGSGCCRMKAGRSTQRWESGRGEGRIERGVTADKVMLCGEWSVWGCCCRFITANGSVRERGAPKRKLRRSSLRSSQASMHGVRSVCENNNKDATNEVQSSPNATHEGNQVLYHVKDNGALLVHHIIG